MANTKNKQSKAYKNKLTYIKQKNKEKKRFYIVLDPVKDSDIIDFLESNISRKSPYMKTLIRADIATREKSRANSL